MKCLGFFFLPTYLGIHTFNTSHLSQTYLQSRHTVITEAIGWLQLEVPFSSTLFCHTNPQFGRPIGIPAAQNTTLTAAIRPLFCFENFKKTAIIIPIGSLDFIHNK